VPIAYSKGHIRLDPAELQRWRLKRAEAIKDLPLLKALVGQLDLLIGKEDGLLPWRAAVVRRIEESRSRFSID